MNAETKLLDEVRLLRRTVLICTACLVLGMGAAIVILTRDFSSAATQPQQEEAQVDPLMDAKEHPYDPDKALAAAQEYIKRYPNSYYGYSYLGRIHLATGDLIKAEANYSRSYAIAPLYETRLRLAAVRKALGMPPPKE